MRRLAIFAAAVLALSATCAHSDGGNQVIQIETGSHQGFVNRVLWLGSAGLLTISDDQTARSWTLDGKSSAVIRGHAGPRDEGALYAAAASTRYIALGGRAATRNAGFFVRLIERESLKPAGTLANLPDVVTALAFSTDDKKLAVGFNGGGVRIYALGQGAPIAQIATRGASVNDLSFGADGTLAVSSDRLEFFGTDAQLRVTARLPEGFAPWRLARSADGRRLAIGSRSSQRAAILADGGQVTGFCAGEVGAGAAPAVAWLDGQVAIGGNGATGGFIATCDQFGNRSALVSAGEAPVTALAGTANSFAYGNAEGGWGTWTSSGKPIERSTPYKLSFRRIGTSPLRVSSDGLGVSLSNQGAAFAELDLTARKVTPANRLGAQNGLVPPIAPIGAPPGLEPGERPLTQIEIAGSSDQLLGTNFYVRRISPSGKTVWKAPSASAVWGVAVANQAAFAVTAQGDGTLTWHDLSNGRLVLTAIVFPDLAWAAWTPEGFYDRGGKGAERIGYYVARNPRDGGQYIALDRTSNRFFRLDLTLAALRRIGSDRDQLSTARTRIGVASDLVTANPPPIVRIDSVCGVEVNTDRAIACYTGDAIGGHLSARQLVSTDQVDVTLRVEGQGTYGPTIAKVGAVAVEPSGERIIKVDGGERRRFRIALPPGDADLSFAVATSNRSAASDSARLRIDGAARKQSQPTRLFIAAIGISDYQLAMFDLGGGTAANDAAQLSRTLASADNIAFGSKTSVVVTDLNATRPGIRKALDQIAAAAQPSDLVVLFFSGHGDQIDGNYVFAPYELGSASFDRAAADVKRGSKFTEEAMADLYRSEGLQQDELTAYLSRIRAGRVIIVLDTCFGGAFDSLDGLQKNGLTNSVGERIAESSGRYVIAASRGLALDDADKRGAGTSVFTTTILDAINGAADRDHDNAVTLSELGAYVGTEVPLRAASVRVQQRPVISFVGDPYFPVFQRKKP